MFAVFTKPNYLLDLRTACYMLNAYDDTYENHAFIYTW